MMLRLTSKPVDSLIVLVKVAFWAGLVILSTAATRRLIEQARAEFAFEYSTEPNRLTALDLDPAIADYARARGDYWLKRAIPPRLDFAASEYRTALELNPREAFHWSDWGQVCWQMGRIDEAKRAFATADELDPKNHVIQREIGDFLLLQGQVDAAAAHHARAIRLQPGLARGIYVVYWHLGRSPDAIGQALLGDDPALLRRYFLDCLTWVDPEQAERLWKMVGRRAGALDAECYRDYFDFLIAKARFSRAETLWQDIARKFYNAPWNREEDAFWNGKLGFPATSFDGGLEWRIDQHMPPGVQAVISAHQGAEQSSCLWIHFDGKENVAFSHVRHFFFVKPEKMYRLSCWVRAIGITTDNGPYLRLTLYCDPPVRRAGKIVEGTGVWELEEEFVVPPGCRWAEIEIRRDPIMKLDNKIKGDVFYDDFVLEELTPATSETLTQ